MIRIARIEARAFRCPTPRPVATSFGIMHDRPAVFLRVEDPDGAFGWGEVFANWPAAGAEHRVRLLQMDLAPLVLGAEAASPDDLFHRLEAQTRIRAAQCGEVGPFAQVLAGLDMAVWDMAARLAGLPLRRFIRADAPDRVPAYASGIQCSAAPELIPAARAAGHKRFKLKVGFDLAGDLGAVRAAHAALTPPETIACDANQAWTLGEAKAFLAGAQGLPLAWLEEPLPVFAAPADWRDLAQHSEVPLAGGENIFGAAAFADAITAGDLAVIQPDAAKWGGITGCLDVARQSMAAGRRYCPHFLGGGIGLAASAELLAGAGGDGLLEVDVNANPLRSLFFGTGAEPVTEGDWRCTDGPGLGITDLPEGLSEYETLRVDIA